MLKRCMLVLVIIAALFGAPTNVSAGGRQLSVPQAGPGSGTTATALTVTVTYAGRFRTTSGVTDANPADGLLNVVLLVGLSAVAVVALIGVAVILTGRRRDHHDEADDPAARKFAARGTRSSPDATPDAVMQPRKLRHGRVRMPEDPIVAALGIGNESDDRRRARRKAGQVSRGPGERSNINRD